MAVEGCVHSSGTLPKVKVPLSAKKLFHNVELSKKQRSVRVSSDGSVFLSRLSEDTVMCLY